MRGHSSHEAVSARGWVVLIEQLAAHLQSDDLASQPREHPPDGRVMECAFVNGLGSVRCFVAKAHAGGSHGFAIRIAIMLEIMSSELERTRRGVTFIGENERWIIGKYESALAAAPSREQDEVTAYLMVDDQSETTLSHVVWGKGPRQLAARTVRSDALTSVPWLTDGTLMLLNESLKWSGRSRRSNKSNPFWERCEPSWQNRACTSLLCADGTDPPQEEGRGSRSFIPRRGTGRDIGGVRAAN
jgi:hypothetical protein